jgi:hypothetical protein
VVVDLLISLLFLIRFGGAYWHLGAVEQYLYCVNRSSGRWKLNQDGWKGYHLDIDLWLDGTFLRSLACEHPII